MKDSLTERKKGEEKQYNREDKGFCYQKKSVTGVVFEIERL